MSHGKSKPMDPKGHIVEFDNPVVKTIESLQVGLR